MHSGLFHLDCHPQYGSNLRNPSLQYFGYALVFLFGYINHELDESKTYIVLPNVHVSVMSLRINANFKISICGLDKFSSRLCNYAIDSVLLCNYAMEKEKDKNPLFHFLFNSNQC